VVAEKHVRQHAPHSAARSCVRSFVRFFVMTVDETMTYFSGFSLPGCPAALPFTPSLVHSSPFARNQARVQAASPRVHPRPPFIASPSRFLFLCRLFVFFVRPLSLNPFLENDLHVKRVNDCRGITRDSIFNFKS